MEKIDKLLVAARREARKDPKRDKNKQLQAAISKMSTEQLREIIDGSPDDARIKELFASVGALNLVESW